MYATNGDWQFSITRFDHDHFVPMGLTWDDAGNLVVASLRSHNVQTFTPSGKLITEFNPEVDGHCFLDAAVSPKGRVFVVSLANATVKMFEYNVRVS